MNYSLIPLVLIVISVLVALIIIVRRFPELSVLDVDALPEEKQKKKKLAVLKQRAKRASESKKKRDKPSKMTTAIEPAKALLARSVSSLRKKRALVESRLRGAKEQKIISEHKEKPRKEQIGHVRTLMQEGLNALESKDLDTAEQRFIAVIRVEPKNIEAYHRLADVYTAQEQLGEAKETFEFVLQLDKHDDRACIRLAEIAEQQGNMQEAVAYYERAVLLVDHQPEYFAKIADLLTSLEQYEPALDAIEQAVELASSNPKYLDKMVECAIRAGRKNVALEAYQSLRGVNPDNQKLDILKSRIDQLS